MNKAIVNTIKSVLSVILCLTVITGFETPCFAAENEATTVKVGFFSFDGYHEQDENGFKSGYGYEILQHLAGYANIRYEYIGYDKSWNEMQEMLEAGEIDVLTSAQKTPERESRFDFSSECIGYSSTILTVKFGGEKYFMNDYKNWNEMRVGMIEGNSRNESFANYAEEHGFTYVPVYFSSTDEMVEELKDDKENKKINAIVTSNLRSIEGETILSQFDTSPFYIMVRKGNTELLERINQAIEKMNMCEPELRTTLMAKYYTPSNGDEVAYTPEERAYIESMKGTKIKALLNPDRAPYSWLENGQWKGIIYDAAAEVIQRTGLDIEFINIVDRKSYEDAIKNGSADIRIDAEASLNKAEQDKYWLTSTYVTVPIGRLHLKKTTVYHSAAIPYNSDIIYTFSDKLAGKGLTVTLYNSIDEITEAILTKKQDAAYLGIDSATVAVRDDVTNHLVYEEVFGEKISYTIAVNQNQSPTLYSVINKAVISLDDHIVDQIREDYTASMEKPFSLLSYFYSYPLRVVIVVAVLLSLVILIILVISLYKRKQASKVYIENEQKQNALLKDALLNAEKAGEAKSLFLSRVSHELRTPLNAIIGFLELAKSSDKEQMENYLASSDLAAKQLLSVINDVLDMSSIESGKMKIASSPFNLRHLISSITNIYGTQCKQKNILFETKITTPTQDWVTGDELRVNQILLNLLGNAVKFTSEGHIWLTVSEMAIKEDKVFMRFEVSDTGCGMSDEMKARLFKPFEQESANTAKKYGGNGLGLSIVKNLISMMDGTIKVESKLGKGTTFTVDLPFGCSDIMQNIVLPKKANSLRILAVDDEESERDYISTVLDRMKIRYTCVDSGEEALERLKKAEEAEDIYNVCLIDWRMPNMDGVDTTVRIRERYGKDIIVIVVSAYDFQQAGENAKRAGANLFLSKPIFQSSLFDLLMTLTGGEIAKKENASGKWDFAGKRILLAEDNMLNQIVVKGYLAKYNVVVDLAENGKIAVEKFLSSAPGYYEAVLMDIQMPVMDGYEATRAIRESQHSEAKTIQIIAQTADAFNEDISKALSSGMNAHVSKPIKPDILAKVLNQVFNNEQIED